MPSINDENNQTVSPNEVVTGTGQPVTADEAAAGSGAPVTTNEAAQGSGFAQHNDTFIFEIDDSASRFIDAENTQDASELEIVNSEGATPVPTTDHSTEYSDTYISLTHNDVATVTVDDFMM